MNQPCQILPSQHFPGVEQLIREFDAAARMDSDDEIVCRLRSAMCRLIRSGDIQLPAEVSQANADHYARRELFTCPELGYSVIAMTWGPGQGTPIHDHCGMWCVEGVWAGELVVEQYQLLENEGDRFRFEPVGSIQAGAGSAGSLIPPHEYHTITNGSASDIAVSVHVYRGTMRSCNTFRPTGGGWYQREARNLSLDS